MRFAFLRKLLWDMLGIAGWFVACAAIALGCYALNTNHAVFPFEYHPDEDGKIDQLVSDQRNFFHPQLMLESALLMLPDNFRKLDPEQIVQQARHVSAIFVTAAVLLLAFAATAAGGRRGFFAVAICAACCPPLIEAGHYLKEDAALAFGMACVLCAGACFLSVRHAALVFLSSIILGAAAGIAASGKYCGIVFLVLVLILVLAKLWRRSFWIGAVAIALLVTSAAGVWSGINYRVFQHWGDFREGLTSETDHSTIGHRGVMLDRPNGYFIDVVRQEAPTPVLILAAIAPFAWLLQRRPSGFGLWLIACIAGYLLMLSYSAIPFPRYALPATVMTYALAALGFTWITRLDGIDTMRHSRLWHGNLPRILFDRTLGEVFWAIGLFALTFFLGLRALDVDRQFADDSRDALREWVKTLPPGTKIVAEDYTQLEGQNGAHPAFATPAFIVRRMWAGEFGSIDLLQHLGYQYVVTASSSTDRFTSPYTHGQPGDELWFRGQTTFYEQLAMYPIAWQRVARHPLHGFVNPDIRVYAIAKSAK